MIFDSLKNSALYYPVSPRLEKAFGFIASTDWETMEPGIHELDGKDIYVNVMEPELKKPADAKLEIHDAYIDIQVLIRGEQETFGWSERADLRKPLGEFDAGKDIRFFDDEPQTFYTLRPGQFTIFFPEDGHAPMIGEGNVRKIIVKVRKNGRAGLGMRERGFPAEPPLVLPLCCVGFSGCEPHRGVGVAGGAGDKDNPRSRSSGDCVVMCRKSIIFRCRSSAARR